MSSQKSHPSKLPTAVAQRYELVGWFGGTRQHFGRFGIVDLETITPEKAALLVRAGFKKLRDKTAPKAPKKVEGEEK